MNDIHIKKEGGGEQAHVIPPAIRQLAAGADPTVGVRMMITPEIATDWLETRGNNRKVGQSIVDTYARDMKDGRWVFNGAPIQFDEEGKLLNGQHRLWAVIESGCSIDTVVQWNIPRSSQATIDAGHKWQLKDLLYMDGEKNTALLQAALRWVWRDEIGSILSSRGMSNSQAQEVLSRHPGIRRSVDFTATVRSALAPAAAAFLHYKIVENDPGKADEFFHRLSDGVGLTEFNPIYRLRERLLSYHGKGRMHSSEALAISIVAWNAFRAGREIRALVWKGSGAAAQPFPTIDGVTTPQRIQMSKYAKNKNSRRTSEKIRKSDKQVKLASEVKSSTINTGVRREVGTSPNVTHHTGRR